MDIAKLGNIVGPQEMRAPEPSQKAAGGQSIQQVAQEFESVFVEMMLRTMRQSVPKSGFVDGGNAEDIYRSMLDSEYAKILAANNSSGIATAITQYMKTASAAGALRDDAKQVTMKVRSGT